MDKMRSKIKHSLNCAENLHSFYLTLQQKCLSIDDYGNTRVF